VRFIGAGAIGVAAIYTLARLARPVLGGLMSTLAASRAKATSDETDRDMSPQWIIGLTVLCLVIAAWLAFTFARSTVLAPNAGVLTLIAVPFVLIVGFLIAGVCGYMAGLIGASNSPISGVGILSVLGISLILAALFGTGATDPAGAGMGATTSPDAAMTGGAMDTTGTGATPGATGTATGGATAGATTGTGAQ
jgi:putative OPT family oligopeptide transporter